MIYVMMETLSDMGGISVIVGTMCHWHDVCNDGDLCGMGMIYVMMGTYVAWV